MSLHYKHGQSDDFEFSRSTTQTGIPAHERTPLAEANDDPGEDLEDMDAPEDDDDRAGVL